MSAEQVIHPLVAEIMTASLTVTKNVTDRVIANLEEDNKDLRAELEAIRETIEILFDQPYMPQPIYIIRALYPSRETIARYRRGEE